ncbi:hypothetical protein [Caulobacter sp. DWR1-3-2b1]|uniref:hypothetical protein n=1 Tax=Caulobacter sp. DWR1-3-2b1 TaxID=2804670 RepID=UPI003CF4AD94
MGFHALYQWASLLALIVTCGAAVWRGGRPERWAAAAMALAWLGSTFAQRSLQLWGPQTGIMIIDGLLLAALLLIALRSDRWWPMWASGFHGLGVFLHLAVMIDAGIWGRAYYVAGAIFSYLTMIALLIGSLSRPKRPAETPSAG